MNLIQMQNLFCVAEKQLKNILRMVAGNDFYLQWAVSWKHSSWSYWL